MKCDECGVFGCDWRAIPSCPGTHASRCGRIRGKSGRVLSQANGSRGYKVVTYYRDQKNITFKVHRLVLEAWLGAPPEGAQCDHLNRDRADNRLSNLRWATPAENARNSETCRLNEFQVRVARRLREMSGHFWGRTLLCDSWGVTTETLMRAIKGRTWRDA